MWDLLLSFWGPARLAIDVSGASNAYRDLNAAVTSIQSKQALVQQEGVQTGEKIVVADAGSAMQQLDKLSRQDGFKDMPEIKAAREVLEKVQTGKPLNEADMQKLAKAAQVIESKLLQPIREQVAQDMQAALANDGKIDATEEKAIEDKYKKLGVDVNVLNAEELKAMGQPANQVAFKITSAGPEARGPVQTSSQEVTLGEAKVKEGPKEYTPSPHAATVDTFWDDARHKFLKPNSHFFIRPEGGIHTFGDKGQNEKVVNKLPDGSPVPTLQDVIKDDFKKVKGKFSSPEDLQAAIKVGYGKDMPLADATALYNFIEHGKPTAGGPAPTEQDVGTLQRVLGSLKADYNNSVNQSGGYDSKYGFATTETVRKLAERIGDLELKQKETIPAPTVNIAGFDEQVAPKTFRPSADARYLVDNSGSMAPKLASVFTVINNVLGSGDASDKVVGTFGSGDARMKVATSGTIGNIEKSDHANDRQREKNLDQVNLSMEKAFSEIAGKPPSAKGLETFAHCFGLQPSDLQKCLSADKQTLDADKFRNLNIPGFGKDPPGSQESGLKNALAALMLNKEYATATPGKTRELIITTDEPEHKPQYLELVKLLAKQKGVDIKIIALPTKGDPAVSMTDYAKNLHDNRDKLDQLVTKRADKQKELEGLDKNAPANKGKIAFLTNALAKLDLEIAAQNSKVQTMEKAIKVVDLNSIDGDWVKSHYNKGEQGYKWTDSQKTMGLQLD